MPTECLVKTVDGPLTATIKAISMTGHMNFLRETTQARGKEIYILKMGSKHSQHIGDIVHQRQLDLCIKHPFVVKLAYMMWLLESRR